MAKVGTRLGNGARTDNFLSIITIASLRVGRQQNYRR